MSKPDLLSLIRAEIVKLEQAYVLLATAGKMRPGRPKAITESKDRSAKQRKSKLSPAGRAKIAEAQRKRWAKVRKDAK